MEPSKSPTELSLAEQRRAEVIEPGHTFSTVTDKISAIVLKRKTPTGWFLAFAASFSLLMVLLYAVGKVFVQGIGIWGVNEPVGWGFAIVNFVWWIGIGHFAVTASKMANFDQSFRRSHDAVRSLLRRPLSDSPLGPPVAGLLAVSVPEHNVVVAAVP